MSAPEKFFQKLVAAVPFLSKLSFTFFASRSRKRRKSGPKKFEKDVDRCFQPDKVSPVASSNKRLKKVKKHC
jgi:hypothetical protein